MDNLDMILFICFFAAVVLAALLLFHAVGLLYPKFREWRYTRKRFKEIVPFWWRVK